MLKAEGLEYEARGDGEAVLLIHGALIADALFPLMGEAALADRHRLICYRRKGHGGSDPVSGAASIEQQSQDASALLAHLGVERAHVVGHSGGGVIAAELAIQAPGLVHSLVLLEPAITPPDPAALTDAVAPILAAYGSGDLAKAVDLFLSMACGQDWRSVSEKTVPGGPEQAEKDAATFFAVDLPAFIGWSPTFDRDRASRISQPVLYVVGSETVPIVEGAGEHFQSLVPHTEQAVVSGVNHAMQMQDPKAVAATIADFLSRHPL